jgi:DNA repair protein RadA/Sms
VLLYGEPGIGKSTVIGQLIAWILTASQERHIVYLSSEEMVEQIATRLKRLGVPSASPHFTLASTSDVGQVLAVLQGYPGSICIIDSISGLRVSDGMSE